MRPHIRQSNNEEGVSSTTLQHPVQIMLFGKVLHLGRTWEEITHNLELNSGTCSEKMLCAIKLCLMDRLSPQLAISEEEKIAAVREYSWAAKKS